MKLRVLTLVLCMLLLLSSCANIGEVQSTTSSNADTTLDISEASSKYQVKMLWSNYDEYLDES